jgi:hypothetical protein
MLLIALLSKKEPHFQADVPANSEDVRSVLAFSKISATPRGALIQMLRFLDPIDLVVLMVKGDPVPGGEDCHHPRVLNPMEGPLDLFPRIQQSDRTSMGAGGRMTRLCKLQQ